MDIGLAIFLSALVIAAAIIIAGRGKHPAAADTQPESKERPTAEEFKRWEEELVTLRTQWAAVYRAMQDGTELPADIDPVTLPQPLELESILEHLHPEHGNKLARKAFAALLRRGSTEQEARREIAGIFNIAFFGSLHRSIDEQRQYDLEGAEIQADLKATFAEGDAARDEALRRIIDGKDPSDILAPYRQRVKAARQRHGGTATEQQDDEGAEEREVSLGLQDDIAALMLDVAWRRADAVVSAMGDTITVPNADVIDPAAVWVELRFLFVVFPLHLLLEEGLFANYGPLMGPLSVRYLERLRESLAERGVDPKRQTALTNRVPDALDQYEAAVSGKGLEQGAWAVGDVAARRITPGREENAMPLGMMFLSHYTELQSELVELENALVDAGIASRREFAEWRAGRG